LEEYKGIIPEDDYVHKGYLKHPFPRAGYAAMITHMDKGIGQIMALLEELNIEDNTLIIFTSDNGPTYDRIGGSDSEFFKSAGVFRGLKGSVYEGGIRVPFVARWPGKIKPGTTNDLVCAFQDILPTLSEVAGVSDKNPGDLDGISFVPTLLGKDKQEEHEYLYMEFAAYGGQQMVRTGDWKGVRQNMFKDSLQIELYNLAEDIGEQNNVSEQHPEIVEQIRKIMKEARIPSKEFPFKQIDP
jgi:arylsulfatase